MARAGWKIAVEMLRANRPLADVLRLLRSTYTTPCSLRTAVSNVRSTYKIKYGEDAPLLPIGEDTHRECKRLSRRNALKKNSAMLNIDGDALLQYARHTLRHTDEADMYAIALALLVVTGRRTSEIMNGKSKFELVRDRKYVAIFHGQLKTKRQVAYAIPLLASIQRVREGLQALRLKQGQRSKRSPKSNRGVSSKYQSGLRQYALKKPIFSKLNKLHDLRGIYATMTYRSITWGRSQPTPTMATMRFLGHQDLKDANVYTTYNVKYDRKVDIGAWLF